MRKTIFALALVSTLAFAQSGVSLTSSAAPSAADQARHALLAKEAWVVSITPVQINPSALESNVISINIEGKDYRLTGKLTPASGSQSVNGVMTKNTVDSWVGDAGPDTSVVLTREGTNVDGTIFVNSTAYWLTSGGLVKTKAVPYQTTVTPEMVDFHRAEQDALNKKVGKP